MNLAISLKVIPQYCTGHSVLRAKSRDQANNRARIPRTRYCFSINGPCNLKSL